LVEAVCGIQSYAVISDGAIWSSCGGSSGGWIYSYGFGSSSADH
jgi:hypothetical protein